MKLTAVGTVAVTAAVFSGAAWGQAPLAPGKPMAAPLAAPPATPTAAAATPPPAPKPAPELDAMKIFLGKWKCSGKQLAGPFGPEHPITGTAEGTLVVDSFWQSFKYEEKKTKEHPGLKVDGLWGFDQGSKRFVRATVGNRGDWDTGSTTGWEGDKGAEKMVWTGELSGPMGRTPYHHTFVKQGDKAWTHSFEIRGSDGKWFVLSETTCKR
jgi:hypothetical protein